MPGVLASNGPYEIGTKVPVLDGAQYVFIPVCAAQIAWNKNIRPAFPSRNVVTITCRDITMDSVTKIIKGAASLLAILPGIAMLTRIVPVPPTKETLITALSLSVGVAVIIAIMVLQQTLQKLSPLIVALFIIILAISGTLIAIKYVDFATAHMISITDNGLKKRIVTPLKSPQELITIVNGEFHGDWGEAYVSPIRGPRVRQLIKENNGSTYEILVVYLLAAQVLLLIAIVGGAWKAALMLPPSVRVVG
jgi:hypothetical protein